MAALMPRADVETLVQQYLQFQAAAEAFAAEYAAWQGVQRTRYVGSYSFSGTVDIERQVFYLEWYCCGNQDSIEIPLAFLWSPDWIALEEARNADAARLAEEQRAAKAAQDRAQRAEWDLATYQRLKAQYER